MLTSAILTIGDEITRGELVDTNAAWLSDFLLGLGIDVVEHVSVRDDQATISARLKRLSQDNDVVVLSGGLGPTTDDVTRQAIAAALDLDVEDNAHAWEIVKRNMRRYGKEPGPHAARQSWLPQGATVLDNQVGIAPGLRFLLNGASCFSFPGVPAELQAMARIELTLFASQHFEHPIAYRRFRTVGLPESVIAQKIEGLNLRPSIQVGYRAHLGAVDVRLLHNSDRAQTSSDALDQAANTVRDALGPAIYTESERPLEAIVGETLRAKNYKLAVAESCTGGQIGARLTSVAGSSDYLITDVVAYANQAKTELLGVPIDTLRAHGAVSAETVFEMATGIRRRFDTDLAIATTGIAGPSGGSPEKPVGTVWFGITHREGETHTEKHVFSGSREQIQARASLWALELVRRAALGRLFVSDTGKLWAV